MVVKLCFVDFQETKPFPRERHAPECDLASSCVWNEESTYSDREIFLVFGIEMVIDFSIVPWRYLSTHIDTKYFFLREHIESKDIKVIYMPTEDMVADILTKTINGASFQRLANAILGH